MSWQLAESFSFSGETLSNDQYSAEQLIILITISPNPNNWNNAGWAWPAYQIPGLPPTWGESTKILLGIPRLIQIPPVLGGSPYRIGAELRPWISSANLVIYKYAI